MLMLLSVDGHSGSWLFGVKLMKTPFSEKRSI